MRKWTALLLALAMTLSLAACGSSGNQENASDMSGIRRRLGSGRNACPHRHRNTRSSAG